ncbi:zinc finger CCCH domain-containing protein 15 [Striga asiatica]|uniref:Zinc finger CCCH domain-containing protein 15 n=1 Tax=Striga asiatica TaxID=4170 RepID=A0A5A7QRB7_STRAF|nr:zinc finger CCCH domain-containing protein 15 [Striga asiatica]
MGADAEENQQGAEPELAISRTVPNPNPNSITEAQFAAWKHRKVTWILMRYEDGIVHVANTSARKAEAERKRAEDIASGLVQMNGRELFAHEPWVFDNTRY